MKLPPFTWFSDLLLLKSPFNYRPIRSYIVLNNKHIVILATFGNNQTNSFALGLEEQLQCTNKCDRASKTRPSGHKIPYSVKLWRWKSLTNLTNTCWIVKVLPTKILHLENLSIAYFPITHKKNQNAPEDKEPPEGKELSNLSGPYLSPETSYTHIVIVINS